VDLLLYEGMSRKRLLTGLQPTGPLHIGNYFGALKPFVDIYEEYDSFLMIADYHALTSVRNPDELRKNTENIVLDYLAAGVDPEKAIIFRQSDVAEHTELAWIFECLVTVPFLEQAHAYKDKVAKGLEATAGLFNYPMLMASDILLYDTDVVPVGKDQKQHIEYAREASSKFNLAYGDTFKFPKELLLSGAETVPGTDGQKMSKSYKNTISLFAEKEEIVKQVMGILTDSNGTRPELVFDLHKLFKDEDSLERLYRENEGNYKALKEALINDISGEFAPMQEKRKLYKADEDGVRSILERGATLAREYAREKMIGVRRKIGISK
jgi:tryptophanyl-tRNA synthetase